MDLGSLAGQLPALKQPKKPTNFADINFILNLYTIKDLRVIAEKLELNRLFGKRTKTGEGISITNLTKKELIDELNKYYSVEWKKTGEESSGDKINNDDLFSRFSIEDMREIVKLIGQSKTIKVKGVKRDELESKLKPLITFYLIPNEENIIQKQMAVFEKKEQMNTSETTGIAPEIKTIINNYIKNDIQYDDKISKANIIDNIKGIFINTLDDLESSSKRRAISGVLPEILLNKFDDTYKELLPIQEDKQKRLTPEKQTFETITIKLAIAEAKRYMRLIFKELPNIIDIKELRQLKLSNEAETVGDLLGKSVAIGERKVPVKKEPTETKQPRGRPKVDKPIEIPIDTGKRAYKKKADKQLDIKTYSELIQTLQDIKSKYDRDEILKIRLLNPIKHPKFYTTLYEFQTIYLRAVSDADNTDMREELFNYYNEQFILSNRSEVDLEKQSGGKLKANIKEIPIDTIITNLGNLIRLYRNIPELQREAIEKSKEDKVKLKAEKKQRKSMGI
jgi:hypothetical protein